MNVLSVRRSTGFFEDIQASPFCLSFKIIIVMKNSVEHCGSNTDTGNTKSLTKEKKTCPISTCSIACKGSFPKFHQLYRVIQKDGLNFVSLYFKIRNW